MGRRVYLVMFLLVLVAGLVFIDSLRSHLLPSKEATDYMYKASECKNFNEMIEQLQAVRKKTLEKLSKPLSKWLFTNQEKVAVYIDENIAVLNYYKLVYSAAEAEVALNKTRDILKMWYKWMNDYDMKLERFVQTIGSIFVILLIILGYKAFVSEKRKKEVNK